MPMNVGEFIHEQRIQLDWRANSKRQLFQELAGAVERETEIDHAAVLTALIHREKLGTTGIGGGIAVPHARLENLSSLLGFFVRLARPIDYDALDDEPVDLVVLVVAPEAGSSDQLKALARIARLLRDPNLTARLRSETDPAQVHALLCGRHDEGAG